jgi:hypothetical protein
MRGDVVYDGKAYYRRPGGRRPQGGLEESAQGGTVENWL